MQQVLLAALEQQPLTAEALGLLHQGHLHVLEMHADGTVTEVMPSDTVVPQEVAELQRFKRLVDELQQQHVQELGKRQQQTARGVALGVCVLLAVVAAWAWARSVSDWADVWRRLSCQAVLFWRHIAVQVDDRLLHGRRRPIMADGVQGAGRSVLPAWKQQRRQAVAVRAVSGACMPRAHAAAGLGSTED